MAEGGQGHFIDSLSSELRNKLSVSGQLSGDVWKHSIRAKNPLPGYIQERLAPLRGLCTYDLLEKIRYGGTRIIKGDQGEVYGTVGEWFSGLREMTSDWGYQQGNPSAELREKLAHHGLLSSGWGCMGEELLALDRAARVPRDAPEIEEIYRAVRSVPEWVTAQTRERHTDYPGIPTEIRPIGSYPSDAKVLDIDEFDFIMICEPKWFTDYQEFDEIVRKVVEGLRAPAPHHQKFPPLTAEPHVVSVFPHGPAICVELGWLCDKHNHEHKLCVDMTVTWRSRSRLLKDACKKLADLPVYKDVYSSIGETESAVLLGRGDLSTTVLDDQMSAAMYSVSPNTLSAYRLMKVLTHYVVPSTLTGLTGITPQGYDLAGLVSSHNIKSIMYKHVLDHPDPKDWETENLHLRVAEMILSIDIHKKEADFLSELLVRKPREAMASDREQTKEVARLMFIKAIGSHGNNCKALAEYVMSDYGKKEPPKEFVNLPKRAAYYILEEDVMHIINSDPARIRQLGCIKGDILLYKISNSEMMYETHPMIIWCKSFMYSLYQKVPGADMSQIEEEWFKYLWALYRANIIYRESLSNIDYALDKLMIFLNVSKVFHGDADYLASSIQIGVCQETLVNSVCERYPDEYQNPLFDLQSLLEEHDATDDIDEKIFIYQWCIKNGESGCKDLGRDIVNPGQATPKRAQLLELMDDIFIIIRRFTKQGGYYLEPHILMYYLIKHILLKNESYLLEVSLDEDRDNDTTLSQMIEENKRRKISNFYTEEGDDFIVIRVNPDESSFLRCVATFGNIDLANNDRSSSGRHTTIKGHNREEKHLQRIIEEISKLCSQFDAFLSDVSPLSKNIAAVSYLTKSPVVIHAYKYEHSYGCRLVVSEGARLPQGFYRDREPIRVIFTPATTNQVEHYDLMIPTKRLVATTICWVPPEVYDEGIFDEYASYASEADKNVSFGEVLQDIEQSNYYVSLLTEHEKMFAEDEEANFKDAEDEEDSEDGETGSIHEDDEEDDIK